MLFLVPSLDLIVSWNDSRIQDHDKSPGNPSTKMNQAVRLIRDAVVARWEFPLASRDGLR